MMAHSMALVSLPKPHRACTLNYNQSANCNNQPPLLQYYKKTHSLPRLSTGEGHLPNSAAIFFCMEYILRYCCSDNSRYAVCFSYIGTYTCCSNHYSVWAEMWSIIATLLLILVSVQGQRKYCSLESLIK